MERSKSTNGSGLFLLELTFAILFFAIASSVCLQIFAKAHTMTSDAAELSRAVAECSSAAEIVDSAGSSEELFGTFSAAYPMCSISGTTLEVSYDKSFEPCSDDAAAQYKMTVGISEGSGGITAEIAFSSADGEIYSLSVFRHIQGRAEK